MPANYVGDPTATQAPSAPPTPGATPTLAIPVDGDAANAASVAQDLKAAADFIAWLFSPRAKASAWATAIMPFMDARLRRRFIVDHFGLPRGEWLSWRERFARRGDWTHAAGAAWSVNDWDFALTETTPSASNVRAQGPLASVGFAAQTYLSIEIDNAGINTGEMKLPPDSNTSVWSPDTLASLDYNLNLVDSDAATTWVHGVCGQSEHINTITTGAFFISGAGGNWHARTKNGGTPTDTDTGVASTAGTAHHFQIVIVGANIDDASAARCLFLIDGVVKANHTTAIPTTGTQVHPIWGGFTSGAGGSTKTIHVGTPGWVQNTSQATP